ncbi:MAG: glycosyltransferase family 4 protein [Helicobacteraceae bacterium]|jgi:glycosyltransferase involved in cell wall biosynthesis|nr:glycosyltransferase family 4 protein [Helicobacteraceae bacterium]
MRIAHINLARGFRGGERQTELLIRELAKMDIKQTLVCRKDSPLIERLRDIKSLELYFANYFFSGHIGAIKSDLLHAHEAKAARWAWIENILRKTPYIITRRVLNALKPKTRVVYKKASAVAAISKAIKEILLSYDPSLNVSVILSAACDVAPNSQKCEEIRKAFAGKTIIGSIGALAEYKGQRYLIDAARMLKRDDLAFVFLGEGEDEAKLKQSAEGLNNVYFLGFKNNVADYIAAFDLFVFPSLQEGLGSTLIDAMRLEVPIIASDVGGIPDLIAHNITGFLVPPKDAGAIKTAIEKALKADLSAIVSAAKEKSYLFSSENMTSEYMKLYLSITAKDINNDKGI